MDEVEELGDNVGPKTGESDQNAEPEWRPEADTTEMQLSGEERGVLEALRAKPYALRTLKGVTTDSDTDVGEARVLLGRLESLGLANTNSH